MSLGSKPVNSDHTKKRAEYLQILSQNLTTESLKILAEKSAKKGINEKIQMYKNLI